MPAPLPPAGLAPAGPAPGGDRLSWQAPRALEAPAEAAPSWGQRLLDLPGSAPFSAALELASFPLPTALSRPLCLAGVLAGIHQAFTAATQGEGGPDLWGVAEGLGNAAYCLADALGLDSTVGGDYGAPLTGVGQLGALGALLSGAIASVRQAQLLLKGEDEEGQALQGAAKTAAVMALLASAAQALGGALMCFPEAQELASGVIMLAGALGLGNLALEAWPQQAEKLSRRARHLVGGGD